MSPKIYQIIRGDVELKSVKRVLKFCGIKVEKVDRLGHYVVGKYENIHKRKEFLELVCKRAKEC